MRKKGYLKLKDSTSTEKTLQELTQKFTIRDLAKELDLSPRTINKILNGKRAMTSSMAKIAIKLDVKLTAIAEVA